MDVQEIVQQFLTREDRYKELLKVQSDAHDHIKHLSDENDRLKKQLEEHQINQSGSNRDTIMVVEEYRNRLKEVNKDAEEEKKAAERAEVTIEQTRILLQRSTYHFTGVEEPTPRIDELPESLEKLQYLLDRLVAEIGGRLEESSKEDPVLSKYDLPKSDPTEDDKNILLSKRATELYHKVFLGRNAKPASSNIRVASTRTASPKPDVIEEEADDMPFIMSSMRTQDAVEELIDRSTLKKLSNLLVEKETTVKQRRKPNA